jgi:predicted transcriptional regulator
MTPTSEEKLLPIIRASVAEKLFQMGFKAKEIASVLNVTPAAITQYLKGRRGNKLAEAKSVNQIIAPLADGIGCATLCVSKCTVHLRDIH